MEAYAMATMRNLPNPHPIYKLLRPHFRYTMAINTAARATLVNKGGIIDKLFAIGGDGKEQLMQRVSMHYHVHWTNIAKSVEDREVDDPEKLPGYFYRDDGMKIWRAIERFVGGVVDNFYEDDEHVEEDTELQEWARDIHENAFPGYFEAEAGHGFPEKITSKTDLTEYCTLIIFTGSAQHACVNFGQYEIYGFIPNASYTLRRPAPSKKGCADYSVLLNTLPSKADAAHQVAMADLLIQYSRDEVSNVATEFTVTDYSHTSLCEYVSL